VTAPALFIARCGPFPHPEGRRVAALVVRTGDTYIRAHGPAEWTGVLASTFARTGSEEERQ